MFRVDLAGIRDMLRGDPIQLETAAQKKLSVCLRNVRLEAYSWQLSVTSCSTFSQPQLHPLYRVARPS
jgi:hypothetical protein